ncbi:MAG: hypothetical protein ACYTFA_12705 [Planctomycetota bacterium]
MPYLPLDEANNERFNRMIHEFVTQSQFVVIIHSKWTMNAADRLYSITVQEPGVSARVSVELTGKKGKKGTFYFLLPVNIHRIRSSDSLTNEGRRIGRAPLC